MKISNAKFAAEVITDKGRYYKFDDIACMIQYVKGNTKVAYSSIFVSDYGNDNKLIPAESSLYLKGGSISSPMRGDVAAFQTQQDFDAIGKNLNATQTSWAELFNSY